MPTPITPTKQEMQVELRPARLKALRAERHRRILPVPEHFRDDRMQVRADRRYTLPAGAVADVRGVASFENRRVRIRMRAPRGPAR